MLFQLLKINELKSEYNIIKAVAISSPKFHNLIIDNLIVHNRNTITIICNFIHQNHKETLTKNVFHDAKVEDYFKEKHCYFAGRKIEAGNTFSDYGIRYNDILYIF
jgi:hypothetical protein